MRLDFAMAITLLAAASAFGGDDAPARPLGPSYDAPSVRFLDIIFYYEDWESSLAGARMERPPHLPAIPDHRPDIVPDSLTGSLVAACAVLEWPVIAGGVDLSQSEADLAASIMGTNSIREWNLQDALERGNIVVDQRQAGQPVVALKLQSWMGTDASFDRLAALTRLHTLEVKSSYGISSSGDPLCAVTDAGLRHLKGLKLLRSLKLSQLPKVTDVGLATVAEMNQLRELSLGNATFTDAGLLQLSSLGKLESLELWCPKLTNRGLWAILKSHPQLRDLDLSLSTIHPMDAQHDRPYALDERSLDGLRNVPHLRSLTLRDWGSPDTDAGFNASLIHLKGLAELETLDVWSLNMTDAGLEVVGTLSGLRKLTLRHAIAPMPVNDRGLKHLSGLTRLEEVNLSQTQVTEAGFDELRRMFPKARIVAR